MLITLVIIGVIAALTIPNLMQKYQEQTTVKKLQKFYSNLSNAYSLAMKDNGTVTDWGMATQNTAANNTANAEKTYEILFKPYFKIAKICGIANTGNCIANTHYKYLNNTNWITGLNTEFYKAKLDDGSSIFWKVSNGKTLITYYDTNGIKEPNQLGRDTFSIIIHEKGKIFPNGLTLTSTSESFENTCKTGTGTGYGCAAWVVYKGNMDYLHCDGLTWKSKSCKEK